MIPAGEDKTSFERHNRVLKLEYAKTHPNVSVVKELMKTTFAMRRRDLLSHGHSENTPVFSHLTMYVILDRFFSKVLSQFVNKF